MNYITKNNKLEAVTEKTLVVGIDVGSQKHYARAFDWRGKEFSKKAFGFKNSKEGFLQLKNWMDELALNNDKHHVIVGLEPTGHYWFNLGSFLKNNGIEMVHVNPHHVKKSKELDDNTPSKSDEKDPRIIATLVVEGRYLRPILAEDIYAEIRNLSNKRFALQGDRIRVKNRIAKWISMYFPEYSAIYRNIYSVSGLMILKELSLPKDIVEKGAEYINSLWRSHKIRAVGMKRAQEIVEAATDSIGYQEGLISARMDIIDLIDTYETLDSKIAEVVQRLNQEVSKIDYADKLLEIDGIGEKIVASFIAEVGDIRRFNDPKQIQKLAGCAIVSNSSGKYKGKSHLSYRGRKRLRYVLYEAAISALARNTQFKEIYKYYTTRDKNPLKRMQAVMAIACKLIRIFYAVLTKGIDYDGNKMLSDIKRQDKIDLKAS